MKRWLLIASLAGLLAACGEPLREPGEVDEARLLGARWKVEGVAEAAWPAAGETATLEWWLADPQGPRDVAWSLFACAALPSADGQPLCEGEPFWQGTRDPSQEALEVAIPIPASFSAGEANLLVGGVLCIDAAAVGEGSFEAVDCAGGPVVPLWSYVTTGVRGEGATNEHPRFASVPLMLGGKPWLAESAAGKCGDAAVPSVRAGSVTVVQMRPDAASREAQSTVSPDVPDEETFQLSGYVDRGKLERVYTLFEPGVAVEAVDYDYTAPGEVDGDGALARGWFALRDLRGGMVWAERAVCVVP